MGAHDASSPPTASGLRLGLTTDLYELTMAASYLRHDRRGWATFSLFVRRLPTGRGFLVAAGLDGLIDALETYGFDEEALAWLRAQGFGDEVVDQLRALRFTGEVRAVPEGTVVFADEPLLEISAPLPEAQLVETLALNQLTYATAIASKAARYVIAARGRATLVDFSLRRTHGLEAGFTAARSAMIAGFVGTSNADAARRLGVPAVGTMAHSYVQSFVDERAAFRTYAADFPDATTFLVDTYDTRRGVETAIEVADELGLRPDRVGVRIDSGDLHELAVAARQRLDGAGYGAARIVVSGGLDDVDVARLVDGGAPIDVFGIGTKMGTSSDAPSLDTAYKLVAYDARPVMKLSPGKVSLPGAKQVHRALDDDVDVLATLDEPAPRRSRPLLEPVMHEGRRVGERASLASSARRCAADLAWLPDAARSLTDPVTPIVRTSTALQELADRVRAEHAEH